MPAAHTVRSFFAGLKALFSNEPRPVPFECGDCEIWESCGRTPDEECIPRAEQIERQQNSPGMGDRRTFRRYLPSA